MAAAALLRASRIWPCNAPMAVEAESMVESRLIRGQRGLERANCRLCIRENGRYLGRLGGGEIEQRGQTRHLVGDHYCRVRGSDIERAESLTEHQAGE